MTRLHGRAVRELAAEKIDARRELLQNVEPAAFDIPTQRFVPAGASSAGGDLGWVLPEVLVEVFVFQDAKHQRLVVLETGIADSFDELNQSGSFQRSAWTTHKDDQTGVRCVADQRQEVVAAASDQNVPVGIHLSEDFVIGRRCRQDFSQSEAFVLQRFQGEGGIFGHVVVEEEVHAPVCI